MYYSVKKFSSLHWLVFNFLHAFLYNGVYYGWSNRLPPQPPPTFVLFSAQTDLTQLCVTILLIIYKTLQFNFATNFLPLKFNHVNFTHHFLLESYLFRPVLFHSLQSIVQISSSKWDVEKFEIGPPTNLFLVEIVRE